MKNSFHLIAIPKIKIHFSQIKQITQIKPVNKFQQFKQKINEVIVNMIQSICNIR